MLTIKYEIRSIHEKLDIIIQRDEENTLTKTRESQLLYDTCFIVDKLPIKNQKNLEEFENELSIDKNYRHQLVCNLFKHIICTLYLYTKVKLLSI